MRDRLLHAIRTHLHVMQMPTETLCVFCLKMIDILIDTDEKRIESDSKELLRGLLNNMLESIIEAIDKIENQEKESNKILSPAMSNTRNILKDLVKSLEYTSEAEAFDHSDKVTQEIAKAFKLFNFCGLTKNIHIKDMKGNPIC